MNVGLVLSGGGARGVAHIGVIQALEEFGIKATMISGTSAGSIVGSLYSHGHSPKDMLSIVSQATIFSSVRPSLVSGGLLRMDGLGQLLKKHLPDDFSKLKRPMTIAATDLKKGEMTYFNSGELVPAILSSCCVPGVFSPISFKGSLFVDGGVMDNLPVRPLHGKCDFIIGSHCNGVSPTFDVTNFLVVVERSLLMAIGANTLHSKNLCDAVIEPAGLDKFSGFDIGKAKEIFDLGYRYTKENLGKLNFDKILG
ncbi:MAG: patatin-like phospholipase family protein [Cyclobacteriaceae bacterium]|nr:patatin-like phospholipase family protein [Cyclobacteriaceae bacterium]